MHNRNTFFTAAAFGSACLVSTFVGCSSSSSTASPGNDSGAGGDTSTIDTGMAEDSATPTEGGGNDSGGPKGDSGTSSEGGAAIDCKNGTWPTGTPIYASSTASVQGLTTDGQVIFYSTADKTINAIPIAGGTPTMLSAYDLSGLFISGKVVMYSHAPAAATATAPSIGVLQAWTAGGTLKTLSAAAYQSYVGGGYLDVSSDSSHVVYTVTTAATPSKADIVVSGPDGSNPVTLVSGAFYNGTDCVPDVRFVGSDIVAAYCSAAPADASTLAATITVFSGVGFASKQNLSTAAFFGFSFDKAYTQIAYTEAGGQYVQTIGTMTRTLIDAKGVGGASFTADGKNLIYYEQGGLYRSSIATPAPQQIVAAATLSGTLALSPDDNWLVTYENANGSTGLTDMYLVNTAAGSTLNAICPTTTAAFFGDQFTVDGTHLLFFCNITTQGAGLVGDFDAQPLTAGSMKRVVAPGNVWQANTTGTTGARALYNDNYTGGGPSGYADIKSVDLSGTAAPTPVVSEADANFYVTADKKTLVYSFSVCAPAQGAAGIYAITPP